jgi:hypothetical protein
MNPLSRRLCEIIEARGEGAASFVVRDLRETPEGWEVEMG